MAKLGIAVEPKQVRLITNKDDQYAWQVLSEKGYLFTKHRSKHSIGAYRELCREVGVSFEAVSAAEASEDKMAQMESKDKSDE